MSLDALQEKIRKVKNPTVAGLDARLEYIPPKLVQACFDKYGEDLEGAAQAVYRYNCDLMDALQGVVPAVKPQAAYYELLGWPGVKALHDTIAYAHDKGYYVIADIKRGDIGSTAQAYAEGWLGKSKVGAQLIAPFDADCVTINGYMGSDAILPFLDIAKAEGKAVFLLVKTSNPSSGELQDMVAGDRQVYTVMADLCKRLGADSEGQRGYQALGAVVGATYPAELRELRRRMEHTFFLVPGYGAQGGTAEDVRHAFDRYGWGAIINSSRGILCAWKKEEGGEENYQAAAKKAAEAMRDDIKQYVTIV